MTEHTATYSPEDNKLRLYPASKLDPATYARVKEAGFQWAPKQRLFVAPAWTPAREDLLLELCGEVGDEDTSLVDRAEERAERFSERSDNHAEEADAARRGAAAIADRIPFGQPILVGHHSERRARKDAERIENGMRKAVSMWASAEYWSKRAAAALRHAKHKERPDVRARRIKSLDADKRKQERARDEALYWLEWWSADGLTEQHAVTLASRCNLRLPRKDGDSEDLHSGPSGYDALTNGHPSLYAPRTLAEIVEAAKKQFQDTAAWTQRWIDHYANRLAYERAMLAEQGGLIAETVDLQPGGRVLVRGDWLTILRVTRRDGKALSVTTDARGVAVRPVDEITDYQAPTAETTAAAAAATATAPLANYERADFVRITRAEYQAVPSDYRGHKAIAAAGIHGAHRVRYVLGAFLTAEQRGQRPRHDSYFVFITDDKRKDPPVSAQQLATPVRATD